MAYIKTYSTIHEIKLFIYRVYVSVSARGCTFCFYSGQPDSARVCFSRWVIAWVRLGTIPILCLAYGNGGHTKLIDKCTTLLHLTPAVLLYSSPLWRNPITRVPKSGSQKGEPAFGTTQTHPFGGTRSCARDIVWGQYIVLAHPERD